MIPLTSCIVYLGKYWFTVLCWSSKCGLNSLCNTKKSHSLLLPYWKGLQEWGCYGPIMTETSFLIFASVPKFITDKYYQLFSSKWQTCFIIFWENVCQTSNLNNCSLYISHFFKVKVMLHEKMADTVYNSKNHTSAFPSGNYQISVCNKLFYAYFLSVPRVLKRCIKVNT